MQKLKQAMRLLLAAALCLPVGGQEAEQLPGLVFHAQMDVAGWIGAGQHGAKLEEENTFIKLAFKPVAHSGIEIELRLSDYFQLGFKPESQLEAGGFLGEARVYSNILQALGSNQSANLTFSLGKFTKKPSYFIPYAFADADDLLLNKGANALRDALNWSLELALKPDIFPLEFIIAGDLDFGAQAHDKLSWNNKGVSGFVELRALSVVVPAIALIDFNLYYAGNLLSKTEGKETLAENGSIEHHAGGGVAFTALNLPVALKAGAAGEFFYKRGFGASVSAAQTGYDFALGLEAGLREVLMLYADFSIQQESTRGAKTDYRLAFKGSLDLLPNSSFYVGIHMLLNSDYNFDRNLSYEAGCQWRPFDGFSLATGWQYGKESILSLGRFSEGAGLWFLRSVYKL